jgi:amino acid transporter
MVIRAALTLLGIIFLVIIVFAGYRWMTASGNEEAIQKAQSSIKRAIIGLVIVMLAYAITAFVFNQLPFGAVGGISGPMGS